MFPDQVYYAIAVIAIVIAFIVAIGGLTTARSAVDILFTITFTIAAVTFALVMMMEARLNDEPASISPVEIGVMIGGIYTLAMTVITIVAIMCEGRTRNKKVQQAPEAG